MCMSIKNDGNNIVLNKMNTLAALLDYKYSIYSMIFFTFACKESSFFWHSIDHIAHLPIADVNLNWISCIVNLTTGKLYAIISSAIINTSQNF